MHRGVRRAAAKLRGAGISHERVCGRGKKMPAQGIQKNCRRAERRKKPHLKRCGFLFAAERGYGGVSGVQFDYTAEYKKAQYSWLIFLRALFSHFIATLKRAYPCMLTSKRGGRDVRAL